MPGVGDGSRVARGFRATGGRVGRGTSKHGTVRGRGYKKRRSQPAKYNASLLLDRDKEAFLIAPLVFPVLYSHGSLYYTLFLRLLAYPLGFNCFRVGTLNS